MRTLKKLKVWKKLYALTLNICETIKLFPEQKFYGITSQLRKAAASIPTNIAGGCGKRKEKDFARCLSIAAGSTSEMEYLIMLSKRFNSSYARFGRP